MKLESFRIKNFRSLEDSGVCHLSPDITILAGKNESGKSSILAALEKISPESKLTSEDYPGYSTKDGINIEIHYDFVLNANEANEILKYLCYAGSIRVDEKKRIRIKRTNDIFEVSGQLKDEVAGGKYKRKVLKSDLSHEVGQLNSILPRYGFGQIRSVTDQTNPVDFVETISNLRLTYENNKQRFSGEDRTSFLKRVDTIENIYLSSIASDSSSFSIFFDKKVLSMLSKAVLFDSFTDKFPSEVHINELENDHQLKTNYRLIGDFAKLSGLDLNALRDAKTAQERVNIASRASDVCTNEFGKYWKQDPLYITVDYSDQKLSFFIQDIDQTRGGNQRTPIYHRVDQRSQGLQWYIAFFLRLQAEGKSSGNIILIDEPGLYLHAKAQQDVLTLLEELAKENTVIFTTHSPYLIDPDKLARVRLSIKERKTGTTKSIIHNHFNKGADIDTLTPIVTAIGLDLSQGIAFSKVKNVIVEGVSDYYYLHGMLNYLRNGGNSRLLEGIGLIPCVGHTKVSTIASLLIGWGLDNFVIILDKKGTARTREMLIKDGIGEEMIISIGAEPTDSIEDLFSTADQERFGLKSKSISKTITSKLFQEKIIQDSEPLSTETEDNFKELFNKIEQSLVNNCK